jgi:type III secretion system low calcium response chaperone LcrH/SycD
MKIKLIKPGQWQADNMASVTTLSEISDLFGINEQVLNGRACFKISPESYETLYATAYELYKNGKYEVAKSFFRFLTLTDSFERKNWMGLAACYQMLKLYEEAIECYSAAAVQDPSDPYVHWHAADCYFHLDNLVKAKAALDSAIITANADETYGVIIPKLELIKSTWANMKIEGSV